MNLKSVLVAATTTAILGWASTAGAAGYTSATSVLTGGSLIDFEDLANGTLVDTQYAGVTFSQTPGGGRPQIDEAPAIFGYGFSSGSKALTGSTEGGVTFDTIAGINVAFGAGKNAVEFFFSDTAPLGDYSVVFYGLGGAVLETVTLSQASILPAGYSGGVFPAPGTFPLPGLFVGYTSAGNDIYGIGIGPGAASNDSFAIDDLRFAAGGGVPEPATWAMMLMGFGGLGAVLRRRSRVALA